MPQCYSWRRQWPSVPNYAQNPLDTFPRNFPVDGEVSNLLATSRCNGIWETTRHNGHNGLLCPRQLVTDLQVATYEETGVMDFCLYTYRLLSLIVDL